MRVVSVTTSNVMKVGLVEVSHPQEHVQLVGGDNAQGKTSFLNSIAMALGGKRLCPAVPLKEGEDRGYVELDVGDYRIRRDFIRTADGDGYFSELTVWNASGEPLKRPQSILDEIVGKLSFDPLQFADKMSPLEQAQTLRDLVGLDVWELEDERERLYAKRTEAGQVKRATFGAWEQMPHDDELGLTEIAVADTLTDQLEAARSAAVRRESLRGEAERAAERLERVRREIEESRAEAERLNALLLAANKRTVRLTEDLAAATRARDEAQDAHAELSVPDTAAVLAEIEAVDAKNKTIRQNQARHAKSAEVVRTENAWKALEQQVVRLTEQIQARTAAVEYPIPGLELRGRTVYYDGVPFSQASTAQRIRVSLAMGIAMNPNLRVLLIRDGSVLDDKSLAYVRELAREHDAQFFVEMARGFESDPTTVVIRDGAVAANGQGDPSND